MRSVLVGAVAAAVLALGPTPEIHAAEANTRFVQLDDLAQLQRAFSADHGKVRLVALLSPSCGYCVKGYRYMRKLLDDIPDERLRMYVVWEPMLSADTEELARRMSRKAKDPRLVHQSWDGAHLTGKAWQKSMGLGGVAWDVYFLYGADAEWTDSLPAHPDYWQHQGAGGSDNWLNYATLKAKIEQALAAGAF